MEILVVDDERFICDLLDELLVLKGYKVRIAQNGKDAVAKYNRRRSDVIILDIAMPEMNGFEVLDRIKEINSRAEVIMLSAYADSETVKGTLRMGANHFLEKPVEFERLLNILEAIQY